MNKQFSYIILFIFPFFGYTQVVNDAKLWTTFSIEKDIKNLSFSFGLENRMGENFTHAEKTLAELGVEYEIIKNLSGGINYRFEKANEYKDHSFDLRHRFDLILGYQYKVKDFKFKYRIKYQTKTDPRGKPNSNYIRNKLTLEYKIENKKNDIKPFASFELYYRLNNRYEPNRTRTSLGAKVDLTKKSSIKFFYTFENRFNTKNLRYNHIYGVGYSFDL